MKNYKNKTKISKKIKIMSKKIKMNYKNFKIELKFWNKKMKNLKL